MRDVGQCGDRHVAARVASLLRACSDPAALVQNDAGQTLVEEHGSADAVVSWLDRVIAGIAPKAPDTAANRRRARQAAILARYDRGRESQAAISHDLAISARLFHKERRAGLLRVAAVLGLELPADRVQVRDPFAAALEMVDGADRADRPQRTLAAIRTLLGGSERGPHAAMLLAKAVPVLARAGRIAEARHVLVSARRSAAAGIATERRRLEPELLLAELRLCRVANDAVALSKAFAGLRRCLEPLADDGDDRATAILAEAYVDYAESRETVAETLAALADADHLAARTAQIRPATHVAISILRAGVHGLTLEALPDAFAELAAAYAIARKRGFERLATQALRHLADVALITGQPRLSIRLAQAAGRRARRSGRAEWVLESEMMTASAESTLGRPAAALARLAASRNAFTSGSRLDVVCDLAQASFLNKSGMTRESFEVLDRFFERATGADYTGLVGNALLIRSRIATGRRELDAARCDLEAGLPLVERHPTPLQLVRAYDHAFELTGRAAYRDNAYDLRRLLEPACTLPSDLAEAVLIDIADDRDGDEEPRTQVSGSALTPRERQVGELVLAGKTNREIALQLGLSVRTVDQHVQSILRRENVDHRWQVGGAALSS